MGIGGADVLYYSSLLLARTSALSTLKYSTRKDLVTFVFCDIELYEFLRQTHYLMSARYDTSTFALDLDTLKMNNY